MPPLGCHSMPLWGGERKARWDLGGLSLLTLSSPPGVPSPGPQRDFLGLTSLSLTDPSSFPGAKSPHPVKLRRGKANEKEGRNGKEAAGRQMTPHCSHVPRPMAMMATSQCGCPPAPATLPHGLPPAWPPSEIIHTLEISDGFLYCPCLSLKVIAMRSKGPSVVPHCASLALGSCGSSQNVCGLITITGTVTIKSFIQKNNCINEEEEGEVSL